MALAPNSAPTGPLMADIGYYDGAAVSVGAGLFPACRAIYNGSAAQDITCIMTSGNSISFKALPIGIFPFSVTNISVGAGGQLVALY